MRKLIRDAHTGETMSSHLLACSFGKRVQVLSLMSSGAKAAAEQQASYAASEDPYCKRSDCLHLPHMCRRETQQEL